MFVPGVKGPIFRRNTTKREEVPVVAINLREVPCIWPTLCGFCAGLVVLMSGGFMSFIGYYPDTFAELLHENSTTFYTEVSYFHMKNMSYVGPILMGLGFFGMIVTCVTFCECRDRYMRVLPNVNLRAMRKREAYDHIVNEFRKQYFMGIKVPPASGLSSRTMNYDEEQAVVQIRSANPPVIAFTAEGLNESVSQTDDAAISSRYTGDDGERLTDSNLSIYSSILSPEYKHYKSVSESFLHCKRNRYYQTSQYHFLGQTPLSVYDVFNKPLKADDTNILTEADDNRPYVSVKTAGCETSLVVVSFGNTFSAMHKYAFHYYQIILFGGISQYLKLFLLSIWNIAVEAPFWKFLKWCKLGVIILC